MNKVENNPNYTIDLRWDSEYDLFAESSNSKALELHFSDISDPKFSTLQKMLYYYYLTMVSVM